MKKFLAGHRFGTDAEVLPTVRRWLYSIRTDFNEQDIPKLAAQGQLLANQFTDMNPLNFYLWGRLKALVYTSAVPNVEVQQRIEHACGIVRNEILALSAALAVLMLKQPSPPKTNTAWRGRFVAHHAGLRSPA
ncbi:hypothetical protein ANN_17166 [Periplaneta americana]|uniref:Uncharacterized protein n=1 Tax=Periplaneta americana TaxID=6978 RepID=A0ABQ8STL2_PERAM|nr:hypothetical protein ANN_17166 [Periplaneta americana]